MLLLIVRVFAMEMLRMIAKEFAMEAPIWMSAEYVQGQEFLMDSATAMAAFLMSAVFAEVKESLMIAIYVMTTQTMTTPPVIRIAQVNGEALLCLTARVIAVEV
mgnify:FL=1